MRTPVVAGNWKMNGSIASIRQRLSQLTEYDRELSSIDCIVFPPYPYLALVHECLSKSRVKLGSQNVFCEPHGAFTGEVSAPMLGEFGCQYVLIGHSERRHVFAESDALLSKKVSHALAYGLSPVFCVGETDEQREQGLTETVVREQLAGLLDACEHAEDLKRCLLAYEPVWAIGTGKTATPELAQSVHAFIRNTIAEEYPELAQELSILYGGSVNSKNAYSLFDMDDIDGVLVGGASLNASEFVEIMKCIK